MPPLPFYSLKGATRTWKKKHVGHYFYTMMSGTEKRTMFGKAKAEIFRKAAENREQPTASEVLLWERLNKRQLGMRFKRQHPIDRFIVDFYCHPVKLVIELDGRYHQDVEQQNYDDQRTFCLEELGCKVIRFENNQAANDIEGVIQEIETAMALAPSGAVPSSSRWNQRAR